ncbi:MAG TPA: TRAP transporter small permease subunit [Candidatus Caccocola faecigallinarum]|nr:TRAP transporter small permease subunit [Candidatus Caccocola faecigallinarum]
MSLLTSLKGLDLHFAKLIKYILIFLMTAIPCICGLEVVFRYILRRPLHGSDEILILLQIWLYFVGFVSAGRRCSHITARVIEALLKTNEAIARLRAFDAFVAAFVGIYFISMGYEYFKYAWRVWKTTAILLYPTFWYECAPFLCFVPLTIYTFSEFCFYFKRINKCEIDFLHQNEEVDSVLAELHIKEEAK